MAYEAHPRLAALGAGLRVRARGSEALRAAWRVYWPTRLAVFLVAFFAALSLGPPSEERSRGAGPASTGAPVTETGGLGERNALKFDDRALTHSLGGFGDLALSPLARWDAVWYLEIADTGYQDAGPRTAFFPLYPLLARGLGELGGGSRGAVLIAAYLIALAAFLASLVLLWKLVALELGRSLAGPTLLLLTLFPAAVFFAAPYSESLFLLASVGAFLAARTGRWAWAGIAVGAAAATRSAGVLLVVPLIVVWVQSVRAQGPGPGGRRRDLAWLLLGPLGIGAYALYLGVSHGDALAFLDVQQAWHRHFAGPLGGAWDGLVAAFDGARQLLSGSREHVYFTEAAGDPFRIASINLMLFGFLIFALTACFGTLRRLPFAYGLWVAVALMLPLSFPVGPQPLMSLPRFVAVLFPVFMWLALVCEERRWTDRAVGVSALGLGLFVTQFATWHWIS